MDTPHTQAPSSSDQQLAMSSLNMSDVNVGVNQDSMTELDVIGCKDITYESPRLKILVQQKREGETSPPQSQVKEVPGEINATSDTSELKKN
eukprot:scaffold29430_cov27-Attheya_sp.AAC.1